MSRLTWYLLTILLALCAVEARAEDEFPPYIPGAAAPTARGIWVKPGRIQGLPTGTVRTAVINVATGAWGTPDLQDQESQNPPECLAAAITWIINGSSASRLRAFNAIVTAKQSMDSDAEFIQIENGTLSVGRQLLGYIAAADLIVMSEYNPGFDREFRLWLKDLRQRQVGTHTRWNGIAKVSMDSPNNWGAWAMSARVAIDAYLEDWADMDAAVKLFKAWCGDRTAYPGPRQFTTDGNINFFYPSNEVCYASGNATTWTPIAPVGSVIVGTAVSTSGAIVHDVVRGQELTAGDCSLPVGDGGPQAEGQSYSWESIAALFGSAEVIYNTGRYGNPYTYSSSALLRALQYMITTTSNGDIASSAQARWVPYLADKRYGTTYSTSPWTVAGTMPKGRSVGYTNFTHQ